jgi:hypothetical protein
VALVAPKALAAPAVLMALLAAMARQLVRPTPPLMWWLHSQLP